jgi:putative membrane protein
VEQIINVQYVANAFVFSLIGMMVFAIGFYGFDKITPYHLWKELIEKQNTALAIVVGAVSLAIGLIISSAIHG